MLNIVIPVQEETWKLDDCIKSIEQYTTDYTLTIHKNPDLNVGEARQQAMDENKEKFICFLDDDSRMLQDDWSTKLMSAQTEDDTCISFPAEIWEGEGIIRTYTKGVKGVEGCAACMMVDTTKIPDDFKWDKYMGLKTGWLGGDYEEIDYIQRLMKQGLFGVGVPDVEFLHSDRISKADFKLTDRSKTAKIMNILTGIKIQMGNDPEFFRDLVYLKANPDNDRMLASGTVKQCFSGVLKYNQLEGCPMFKKWGLA